jgi:hypothetical protein
MYTRRSIYHTANKMIITILIVVLTLISTWMPYLFANPLLVQP